MEGDAAKELITIIDKTGHAEDVLFFLNKMATSNQVLNDKMRSFFIHNFKKHANSKRKTLQTIEKELLQLNSDSGAYIIKLKAYKQRIYNELSTICEQSEFIINKVLLPNAPDNLSKLDYLKLLGNLQRYKAEFIDEKEREAIVVKIDQYYSQGLEILQDFDVADFRALGFYLNYAVFIYEHQKQPENAVQYLIEKFNQAAEIINQDKEGKYQDSKPYMQMIKDNITIWRREINQSLLAKNSESR